MVWRSLPFWSVIGAFGVFVVLVVGTYLSVAAAWNTARSLTHASVELQVEGAHARTVQVSLRHATCVVRAHGRVVVRNEPSAREGAQIVADLRNGIFSTNVSTGDGSTFYSTDGFRLDGGSVRFDGTSGQFLDIVEGGSPTTARLSGSIPCTEDASGD